MPAARRPDVLEASPADLVFDAGAAPSPWPVTRRRGVRWPGWPRPSAVRARRVPRAGPTFPFGAHVAVAEVDTETGKAVLRGCDRRRRRRRDQPAAGRGQRHGGIAQGAAQALLEEVVYDADGNPLTATFADYAVRRPPSCRVSSWPTWRRRPATTRSGPRDRGGRHDRRDTGRAERVIDALGPPRRAAHRHAHHPQRVWQALRSASAAAPRPGRRGRVAPLPATRRRGTAGRSGRRGRRRT
jgi:carbon-monoxide dehydrogenase large subunit